MVGRLAGWLAGWLNLGIARWLSFDYRFRTFDFETLLLGEGYISSHFTVQYVTKWLLQHKKYKQNQARVQGQSSLLLRATKCYMGISSRLCCDRLITHILMGINSNFTSAVKIRVLYHVELSDMFSHSWFVFISIVFSHVLLE